MKKFYSFVFAAVALVGFAACNSDSVDEAAPVQKGETVTFVANIDTTRTDLNDLQTIWDNDDTIVVKWNEKEYLFTNNGQQDVNTFSCTAEGLSGIVGQPVTATYSNNNDGKVDSTAGTAGAVLTAEGNFGELSFTIQSAFLKYTYEGDSDLVVSLNGEAVSTKTGTDVYVAFMPEGINALAYTLDGVTCKSKDDFTPVAGKVYNLGKLLKKSTWGIAGALNGWAAGDAIPMYELGNGRLVAYNLTDLNKDNNGQGFKFVQNQSWDSESFGCYNDTNSTSNAWHAIGTNNIRTADASAYDVYLNPEALTYYITPAKSDAPEALKLRTIYFKPGKWNSYGAEFEAWSWGNSITDKWSRFTWIEGDGNNAIFAATFIEGTTGFKLLRKGGDQNSFTWDKWQETGDIEIPADKNLITFTAFDGDNMSSYSWGTYSK